MVGESDEKFLRINNFFFFIYKLILITLLYDFMFNKSVLLFIYVKKGFLFILFHLLLYTNKNTNKGSLILEKGKRKKILCECAERTRSARGGGWGGPFPLALKGRICKGFVFKYI